MSALTRAAARPEILRWSVAAMVAAGLHVGVAWLVLTRDPAQAAVDAAGPAVMIELAPVGEESSSTPAQASLENSEPVVDLPPEPLPPEFPPPPQPRVELPPEPPAPEFPPPPTPTVEMPPPVPQPEIEPDRAVDGALSPASEPDRPSASDTRRLS